MTRHIAKLLTAGLMHRGPARGTMAHQLAGIATAVAMGLVAYWARTKG